jgi:hypothetical protein
MTKRIDGQTVEINGHIWKTFINRPVYGTFVNLNEKLLFKAHEADALLIVGCPEAEIKITPIEWMNTAIRSEKVFQRPDQPMVLYGRNVKPYEPVAKPENQQRSLFEGVL